MSMDGWNVGDVFAREDINNRFLDSQVICIANTRYVKSPKTGGLQLYKVRQVDIANKRLVAEGGSYAVEICEKMFDARILGLVESRHTTTTSI